VTDSGRVEFLNRLLGTVDSWANVRAMLADLCAAFALRAAGLRWPAEGPAVLLAETAPTTRPVFQAAVPIPQQVPGLLWADGPVGADDGFLKLAANALGASAALRKFLGPVADQARVAQRLEDAGRVAGRVAHDLDNVFQGVTGFNALALELLEPGSPAWQNVSEADSAARQGMKFCTQLHQLSRGGHARPTPAPVPDALAREAERLGKRFPAVRLVVDAPAELPPVAVDGAGLQLILGRLLDNAAEASPTGGAVEVTARLIELVPADLPGFLGCPATGPHVEIRISDRGPGFTDEDRRRMFVEPFYTTKFRHRGLGLAVVYRMLYAHRGGVQADSRPGEGTTFRVVLPLAAARVPAVETGRSSGGSVT
jgi:signal transduction histidine kinase